MQVANVPLRRSGNSRDSENMRLRLNVNLCARPRRVNLFVGIRNQRFFISKSRLAGIGQRAPLARSLPLSAKRCLKGRCPEMKSRFRAPPIVRSSPWNEIAEPEITEQRLEPSSYFRAGRSRVVGANSRGTKLAKVRVNSRRCFEVRLEIAVIFVLRFRGLESKLAGKGSHPRFVASTRITEPILPGMVVGSGSR